MHLIAWVVDEDFLTQCGAVDVYVDLGGLYALVAKHLLDGSQVGATFEQVCGEGMSQCVWTHRLLDASQLTQLLDDVENHHSCESSSSAVEEEDVFTFGLYNLVATGLLHVEVNLRECLL